MTEKILVVEDQPQVVRLVREVLKAVGYQVLVAGNGQQALEMVALEQPDLVNLYVPILISCAFLSVIRGIGQASAYFSIMDSTISLFM